MNQKLIRDQGILVSGVQEINDWMINKFKRLEHLTVLLQSKNAVAPVKLSVKKKVNDNFKKLERLQKDSKKRSLKRSGVKETAL